MCQYDATRDGQNTAETVLTPSNVSADSFSKTGSWTLDGPVYACPLYVPLFDGTHNGLFVATMNNSMYALDADHPGTVLWYSTFGTPTSGMVTDGTFITTSPGIAGGPVIDTVNGWIFVVAATQPSGTITYTLYKVALATGATVSSQVISGQVVGTGQAYGCCADDTTGMYLNFHAAWQLQRSPLLLLNGNIYFGFGSVNEFNSPWHGWVFEYNESLVQQHVWCSTPNGYGGGVWEASGGIASDGTDLFLFTGNGTYDGAASNDYGNSAIRLSTSLSLLDWFTPSDYVTINDTDADFGSGRLMVVGNYLTIAGKDGRAWLIAKGNMGHLQGTGAAPQVFNIASGVGPSSAGGNYNGVYCGSTSAGTAYWIIAGKSLFSFSFSAGAFTTTPAASTAITASRAFGSCSSNAGSNSLLWMIFKQTVPLTPGQGDLLVVYDPATLEPLFTDFIGQGSQFVAPLIADGHVFVASQATVWKYAVLAAPLNDTTRRGVTDTRGHTTVR